MSTEPAPQLPDTEWQRRFGRPNWRLAMPLAALVTILLWVGTARLADLGSERQAAASPGQPSSRPSVSSEPVEVGAPPGTATWDPVVTMHGGDFGARELFLRSDVLRRLRLPGGELGPSIGPLPDPGRIVRLPDGRLLCACVTVTEAGGRQTLELRLAEIGEEGQPGAGETVTSWTGRPDPEATRAQGGDSVDLAIRLMPDGAHLIVGVAVRKPPAWERSLLVVDVASARVLLGIDLPEIASADFGAPASGNQQPTDEGWPVHAWPPFTEVSPDGRQVLVSTGAIARDSTIEEVHGIASYGFGRIGRLEPISLAEDDDACAGSRPEFAGDSVIFAICHGGLAGPVVRRVAFDGTQLGDVPLTRAQVDGVPLVDHDGAGLLLWNPYSWRATQIDLAGGVVEASAIVPRDISGSRGDPFADTARGLAGWIAPRASAAFIVEPALALSPDGTRMYAIALDGEMIDGGQPSGVLVLDARSLAVLERWAPAGELTSIAVSDDGKLVYTAGIAVPGADDPRAAAATVTVRDAVGGGLRATIGGLGGEPILIVDPAALGE